MGRAGCVYRDGRRRHAHERRLRPSSEAALHLSASRTGLRHGGGGVRKSGQPSGGGLRYHRARSDQCDHRNPGRMDGLHSHAGVFRAGAIRHHGSRIRSPSAQHGSPGVQYRAGSDAADEIRGHGDPAGGDPLSSGKSPLSGGERKTGTGMAGYPAGRAGGRDRDGGAESLRSGGKSGADAAGDSRQRDQRDP